VAALVGVCVFHAWSMLSSIGFKPDLQPHQSDYYNLLTDGFLEGHLHLKAEVPPQLVAAANPYDPRLRPPGNYLHDVSYYAGHYYLYYGVAPTLTLFLPVTLLTGHDVPIYFGNLVYALGGFCMGAALLLSLWRRFFPTVPAATAALLVLAFGLASMVHAVLRRPNFWELPIAGAFGFGMLALWWVHCATQRRPAAAYLALAGAALGLAVASRPTYIVAAPLLAVPLVVWWWQGRGRGEWRIRPAAWWWGRACLVAVTFGGVVAGIMAYNYARFGNPLEFGLNYQLAGVYVAEVTSFAARYVPFNWQVYYLAPMQWSTYFPFIEVIREPAKPEGYYGIEFVYGILCCVPLVWFALAIPAALYRRGPQERQALTVVLAANAWLYLSLGLFLLFFVGAAARYMVDFVPALLLLGCCGVLAVERLLAPGWMRRLVRVGYGALAVVSIAFGVLASWQFHGLFQLNDPTGYRALAWALNHPSHWYDRLAGRAHGPVELQLRFPKDRLGKVEPVLVSGLSYRADYIYVHYPDANHVQIGFEHTGYGGPVSQPIPIDYDAVHTLRLEMGSLYPPEDHPYFDGYQRWQVVGLKHGLKISLDGVTYVETNAQFYDSAPKDVTVGIDRNFSAYGPRFTGTILGQARAPAAAVAPPPGYGAVRLAVRFPRGRTGQSEPLVVTGRTGRGDLLYVTYRDDQTVSFTIDHWGFSETKSLPIPVNYDHIHLLEVDLGSLHPPPAGAAPREGFTRRYSVKLDRVVAMEGEARFHPAETGEIYLLANPIGGSTAGANFTGSILVKEMLEAGPANP
jgi:hypothetical protein